MGNQAAVVKTSAVGSRGCCNWQDSSGGVWGGSDGGSGAVAADEFTRDGAVD